MGAPSPSIPSPGGKIPHIQGFGKFIAGDHWESGNQNQAGHGRAISGCPAPECELGKKKKKTPLTQDPGHSPTRKNNSKHMPGCLLSKEDDSGGRQPPPWYRWGTGVSGLWRPWPQAPSSPSPHPAPPWPGPRPPAEAEPGVPCRLWRVLVPSDWQLGHPGGFCAGHDRGFQPKPHSW